MKKQAVPLTRSKNFAVKGYVKRRISAANPDDSKSTRRHSAYRDAKQKASAYLGDPEKLENLLRKASSKAKSNGPLAAMWGDLMTLFRLVRAYVTRK